MKSATAYAQVLGIGLLALASLTAGAEPPRSTDLAGVALSAAPAQVRDQLERAYPGCEVEQLNYLVNGAPGPVVGKLEVGTLAGADPCRRAQRLRGFTDELAVRFLHADIERGQPAFAVELVRVFDGDRRLGAPDFGEILQSVLGKYGQPTNQSFKAVTEAAPKAPTGGRRFEYEAVWTAKPQKDYFLICLGEETCGRYTLRLRMSGEGPVNAKTTQVKVSGPLFIQLVDQSLAAKQNAWEVEQELAARRKARTF